MGDGPQGSSAGASLCPKPQGLGAAQQLCLHCHQSIPATGLQKSLFCFYGRRWCRVNLLHVAGHFPLLKQDCTVRNHVLAVSSTAAVPEQQDVLCAVGGRGGQTTLRMSKGQDEQMTPLLVNWHLPHHFSHRI